VRDGVCAGAKGRRRRRSLGPRCIVDLIQPRGTKIGITKQHSSLDTEIAIDRTHAHRALPTMALLQSPAASLVKHGFQDSSRHLLEFPAEVSTCIFSLHKLDDVFVEGDALLKVRSLARSAVVGDFFLYAPFALDGA